MRLFELLDNRLKWGKGKGECHRKEGGEMSPTTQESQNATQCDGQLAWL